MWTTGNRGRYDRSNLRYPSDLTDAEWALVAGRVPPQGVGGHWPACRGRPIEAMRSASIALRVSGAAGEHAGGSGMPCRLSEGNHCAFRVIAMFSL